MKPNWFIGWPIAAPLLARAGELPVSVRLFAESDLHVTLAFLGACGEERARAAFATIEAAKPVQVGFGGVQLFGHPRRGTALSATLAAGREVLVARTSEQQDAALSAAEARPETRAPNPHVTIARIARRASKDERERALEWAAEIDLSGLTAVIDRVALYTWSDQRPQVQFRIVDSI